MNLLVAEVPVDATNRRDLKRAFAEKLFAVDPAGKTELSLLAPFISFFSILSVSKVVVSLYNLDSFIPRVPSWVISRISYVFFAFSQLDTLRCIPLFKVLKSSHGSYSRCGNAIAINNS